MEPQAEIPYANSFWTPLDSSSETNCHARIVRDQSLSVDSRIDALYEWISVENDSAAEFVASELSEAGHCDDWLIALVYAAEELRFPRQDHRKVSAALKNIALKLRDRTESGFDQVVWCAVRRSLSLIDEENIDESLALLAPNANIDTRLVAMTSFAQMFEETSPIDRRKVEKLADRAWEISRKLFDPDLIVAGELSALLEQSVLVLGTVGDERFRQCITLLQNCHVDWLSQTIRTKLKELKGRRQSCCDDQALGMITEVLAAWS